MYSYAEMTLLVATEYQRELIAHADQYRLLQRARRAQRAGRRRAAESAPAGTLAPCAPAAV